MGEQTTELRPVPRWRWAYAAVWTAAFAAALCVDRAVAVRAHAGGFDQRVHTAAWAHVLKWPGEFWFTAVVLVLGVATARLPWRSAAYVLAVVAASGSNGLIKWVVGRTRPFKLMDGGPEPRPFDLHPFWHGIGGLVRQQNLTFPSGHAGTAGALAAGLLLVWPRAGRAVAVLAVGTAVERVLENAHYASDVVAAIGLAALLAWAVGRSTWRWVYPTERPPRGFDLGPA